MSYRYFDKISTLLIIVSFSGIKGLNPNIYFPAYNIRMLLLSILYVILTNFDTFYCHRVDSVLNINQIDFKTQLSHFEENFSSTVKPIRSKREVKEGYVVFPELNFTLLLNDSFDGPNTLNTTWNEHSNVEIQDEKVNNKSNVLDKALMVITRKKRQANDQVAPSLQNRYVECLRLWHFPSVIQKEYSSSIIIHSFLAHL